MSQPEIYKITVSKEQAQKLGLLTTHTKSKYPILYDPKTGINFHETKTGEYILVDSSKDLTNYNKLLTMGCFSVVVEEVVDASTNAYLSSLEISQGVLAPEFNKEITEYTATLPFGTAIPTMIYLNEDTNAESTVVDADSIPGTSAITVIAEDEVTTKIYTIEWKAELPVFDSFSFTKESNGGLESNDTLLNDINGVIDDNNMTINLTIPLASQGTSFDVQSLVADWTLNLVGGLTLDNMYVTAEDIDGGTADMHSGSGTMDYSEDVTWRIRFIDDIIDSVFKIYTVTVTVEEQ